MLRAMLDAAQRWCYRLKQLSVSHSGSWFQTQKTSKESDSESEYLFIDIVQVQLDFYMLTHPFQKRISVR